jgi:hypothetical protein
LAGKSGLKGEAPAPLGDLFTAISLFVLTGRLF